MLPIQAPPSLVFEEISTPEGLNRWWTKNCQGRAELGSIYNLDFGTVVWQCQVTDLLKDFELEYTMHQCDEDWLDTQIRFELEAKNEGTMLKFMHMGWPTTNAHYYSSNHCWGLYLRIMRRYLEHQQQTPYEMRLNA